MHLAASFQRLQLPAERRDSVTDHTAVNLKLALALPEPAADTAAGLLLGEMGPHAPQPGKQILQLRQLDLQAALARLCMPPEDIENERRAVYDLHRFAHGVLKVRLLRGSQLVIEDHDVDREPAHHADQLLDLSGTDEGAWHRSVQTLRQAGDDLSSRRMRQSLELIERAVDRPGR